MTHGLERTSPKGGPFVGRCVYCRQEGLPVSAALERCEGAPTQDEQIIDAIEGKSSATCGTLAASFLSDTGETPT